MLIIFLVVIIVEFVICVREIYNKYVSIFNFRFFVFLIGLCVKEKSFSVENDIFVFCV